MRGKFNSLLFAVLIFCAIALAKKSSNNRSAKAIANPFSDSLFTSLLLNDTSHNLFISGVSVFVALLMAANGAQGNTLSEMVAVLSGNTVGQQQQQHSSLQELNEWYLKTMVVDGALSKNNVELANGVFIQEGMNLEPSYVDCLMKAEGSFATTCQSLDFSNPESVQVVNKWVQEATHDKIQNILRAPLFSDDLTRMVLVNAIYFKKSWKHQFDKNLTKPDLFFKTAQHSVNVPMMKMKQKEFQYGEDSFAKWVHLPYQGDECEMIVVLPLKSFALQSVKDNLQSIDFNGSTRKEISILALPKFKVESDLSMKETLIQMGMVSPFDDCADFGAICRSTNLHIDQVIHKTFVVVDEEGTEAAAATVVRFETRGAVSKSLEFIVNEPFLFFIRHIPSGVVVFQGQISEPKGPESKL